ncbi:MAG: hypothetical protein LBK12_08930, partial [Odoribacteraceae bacterium]|nr:hypothetical protein [Odoribacteraceae bacterium]
QCDEAGLIVFSPTENFIVRIRHNALFPVKSQEVTSPQQQIVSATNATISVTTIFSITQQNQFASINLSSFFK